MVLDAQKVEILMPNGRILVIQTAFAGDAILTLPMLQKLKEMYSQSVIDVLATPVSASIFASSRAVDKVIKLDKRGKDKSLLKMVRLGLSLRKEKYDIIFSPHRSFRTGMLVMLSGVKKTYGFSNASLSRAYSVIVPYRKHHHEVERNLELIGYDTDGEKWKILPEMTASPEHTLRIDKFIQTLGNPSLAAVAPGSVWNTKKYPAERYHEIINFLLEKGMEVVLIGGAEDRQYCKDMAAAFGQQVHNAAGEFSIPESVELLKRCRILISNDSAPTHMALCADIPVITIYCSTVPAFGFYPYSQKSDFISYEPLECKPCGIHGHDRCPVGTFACAYKIDLTTIKMRIEKLL